MKKTKFSCGTNMVFYGYDNGDRWNGWYCPLFELDEAKKVIMHFNEQQKLYGGEVYDVFTYSEKLDSIFVETYENGVLVNFYIEQSVIINGQKYYDIANNNYCWEKVN